MDGVWRSRRELRMWTWSRLAPDWERSIDATTLDMSWLMDTFDIFSNTTFGVLNPIQGTVLVRCTKGGGGECVWKALLRSQ